MAIITIASRNVPAVAQDTSQGPAGAIHVSDDLTARADSQERAGTAVFFVSEIRIVDNTDTAHHVYVLYNPKVDVSAGMVTFTRPGASTQTTIPAGSITITANRVVKMFVPPGAPSAFLGDLRPAYRIGS